MRTIKIYLEPYISVLLWVIENGKVRHKGVIKNKDGMNEPIDVALDTTSNDFKIITNYKYIYEAFSQKGFEVELDKELKCDVSDILEYLEKEEPIIHKKIENTETNYNSEFEKMMGNSMMLFKTYLYFLENPEKTRETDFIKSLKKQKIIPEEMEIEDVLCVIEDAFSKDLID